MKQKLFSFFWQERGRCTQEKYFSIHWELLLLHWYNTQDGGLIRLEVWRNGATTYFMRQFITDI